MKEPARNIESGEDVEDLKEARSDKKGPLRARSFWKALGPGLVTGAAGDDPTAVGTYSIAGARFGYSLLWAFVLTTPLMIAVQEMCGRMAVITGKGFAGVMKDHYSWKIVWPCLGILFIANAINIWADLHIMAASAQMLFGQSIGFWLTIIAVGVAVAQILIPYRHYVKVLKWLTLTLFSYVITCLLPEIHLDFGSIVRNSLLPGWRFEKEYVLTFFGVVGGSISPYLFFWQAGEEVEEVIAEGKAKGPGERTVTARKEEIHMVRHDTVAGMVVSQLIGFFILSCSIATLHDRGVVAVETAEQAASALLPLGRIGYYLFTVGVIASGLLAIPTLAGSAAYGIAEVMGWRWGLYRRFSRAQGFYLTIAGITLLGYSLNFLVQMSPVRGLLYSAVLNGIVAPPLILLLLLLCNKREVMGVRVNGLWENAFGVATVVVMTFGAIVSIWALCI